MRGKGSARLVRIEHELIILDAVDCERSQRRYQHAVLIVVRSFVVEWETTVGVIAFFGWLLLDSQERIDKAGSGRLLIRVRKQRAVNRTARS